eukprot:PLAT4361.1.p1 GENE.PLAT4361.1~~PLAT4361.1.p1  ORF type:complete len:301 (-),score=91.55 PLAT4361.1:47-949(-)
MPAVRTLMPQLQWDNVSVSSGEADALRKTLRDQRRKADKLSTTMIRSLKLDDDLHSTLRDVPLTLSPTSKARTGRSRRSSRNRRPTLARRKATLSEVKRPATTTAAIARRRGVLLKREMSFGGMSGLAPRSDGIDLPELYSKLEKLWGALALPQPVRVMYMLTYSNPAFAQRLAAAVQRWRTVLQLSRALSRLAARELALMSGERVDRKTAVAEGDERLLKKHDCFIPFDYAVQQLQFDRASSDAPLPPAGDVEQLSHWLRQLLDAVQLKHDKLVGMLEKEAQLEMTLRMRGDAGTEVAL